MVAVLWYALPAAAALAVLIAFFRAERGVRKLLAGALQGVAALFAVNAAGMLTGVTVAVNPVTLAAAGVFGIPGTIALLLLDAIFR